MVDEVTLPMPLPILLQVTLTLLVPCLAHPQQNLNNQLPFFVVHRINESTSRRECTQKEYIGSAAVFRGKQFEEASKMSLWLFNSFMASNDGRSEDISPIGEHCFSPI